MARIPLRALAQLVPPLEGGFRSICAAESPTKVHMNSRNLPGHPFPVGSSPRQTSMPFPTQETLSAFIVSAANPSSWRGFRV